MIHYRDTPSVRWLLALWPTPMLGGFSLVRGKRMKIQWNEVIKSMDGEPMKVDEKSDRKATLGFMCMRACDFPDPNEKELKVETKVQRWELITKIKSDGDFSKTDLEAIRVRIGAVYQSPWIVGQCLDLLDEAKAARPLGGDGAKLMEDAKN